MERQRKIYIGKCVAILGAIPVLIWANNSGPIVGSTGVPGEGTCSQATCHVGTPNGNQVQITFPGGLTYTPGVTQRLTVTISDTTAGVRGYGFQATARLVSNIRGGQAGAFGTTDPLLLQLCGSSDFIREVTKPAAGCPANAPIEYIEHREPRSTGTFTFDWTPPATDVGQVRIFVAGNAANLNGQNTGDRIHLANYTLNPQAAGPRPTISQGGVVTAGAFGGGTTIAAGSWIEIFGQNLANNTREWAGSDFQGSQAPTSLDNVRVTIANRNAFVRFISPGQVNVQVPDGIGVGPTTLTLSNSNGASDNFSITSAARTPSVLAPPTFLVGGTQYVAALFNNENVFVGRANLVAGAVFRPAKPGDNIVLYAVGFGATNPAAASGQIVSGLPAVPNVTLRFGDTPATVSFAGLSPGFVGLYQINVVVPNVADGDHRLNISADGVAVTQTLSITVQR